jgi:hypothetical protein
MLAANTYAPDYVDDCYSQVEAQLVAYKVMATGGLAAPAAPGATEAFERLFFNNLIVVLDACFAHRTRALEGKDGNPANEVRMLAASILRNKAVLAADKTIKYKPEASVSKLKIGDEIRVDEAGFRAIFEAFFAEIRKKFSA